VPIPPACPRCGGEVRETHVAAQHQEDLPPVTPIVRRFDVHVGWGWMRWDWNWYRQRTADATVARVMARSQPGDIVVMHDGNVYNPAENQRHTVEATARLIPRLRAKGYAFGTF
jgi:peptidoglycan/xylan/chitin deacetylase (PgdA/CDA1 family)